VEELLDAWPQLGLTTREEGRVGLHVGDGLPGG
jgi:hypothetical protein